MQHQEIYLEPNPDGESYPISGSDVQIHTCRIYERSRDSSKVRSRAIIDYRWEPKFYDGRLVAAHKNGNYLAYILHSRNACSVRVINRITKGRALIKNFVGQAVDLLWSFASWPLLLAITDEGGNLMVYSVEESGSATNEITVNKYLHVKGCSSVAPRQAPHRLAWCPYVPDQNVANDAHTDETGTISPASETQQSGAGAADDQAHLLAVYHGSKVDILFIDQILKEHGDETAFSDIVHGMLSLEIDSDISAVVISPDATALALSSQMGEVKFYVLDGSQGITHAQTWNPHKSRPVTSIVFLDNFLVPAQSEEATFWKFALTACDGNRELKLWNCENWACMSTLCIEPPEAQVEHTPLALTADWTSSYVFLTDIERKSLYLVEIAPSSGRIRFGSFIEFPLLHPALSLATVSAGPKRFRPSSPSAEQEDVGESEASNGSTVGVQAFLYAVNPKSLLELDIRFATPQREDIDYSLLSSMASCKLETLHDEVSTELSGDLLRIPPHTPEMSTAAATELLNFDGRRKSTPRRSESPSDRTPTREIEASRRISASPSSQEVSKILANPLSAAGADDPSCLININLSEGDEDRSKTTTISMYSAKASPTITAPLWNQQSNAVAANKGDAQAIGADYTAVTDVLGKMSGELARISDTISRQEEQLQHLKHLVSSQQSMWEAVSHLLEDQRRRGTEDSQSLRLCIDSMNSDHYQQNLTRAVEGAVQRSLDSTIGDEVRNAMIPCMTDSLKPLKDSIQAEVAQKLSSIDAGIRENIGKVMKSKPLVDAIGQAAGRVAAGAATMEAHAAYRESFQKVIAPSFESTAHSLFAQMNDIFQRGTKEYLDQLQRHSTLVQTNIDDCKNSVMGQLATCADQLKLNSERHLAATQAANDKHFDTLSKHLQDSLYATMRSVVKEEVAKAIANGQQALNDTVMRALRSQAPTPVPSAVQQQPDRQQLLNEISFYLNAGQYNAAFQQALQARDTYLVNYVCNRVDPCRIFSETPVPLQQPVILCLLQQLASDLPNYTETKLKYMQEAIPSLEAKSLGEIGTNTLNQIHDKVAAFVQSSSGPHAHRAKTVQMLLACLKTH